MAPSDGSSTSSLGNESAGVLQDFNNAAQAAIHGDGDGKAAALAKAWKDGEAMLSAEGIALVERLVAHEAATGLGIGPLISMIAAKIGGLL